MKRKTLLLVGAAVVAFYLWNRSRSSAPQSGGAESAGAVAGGINAVPVSPTIGQTVTVAQYRLAAFRKGL